jgi:hypothetical protein
MILKFAVADLPPPSSCIPGSASSSSTCRALIRTYRVSLVMNSVGCGLMLCFNQKPMLFLAAASFGVARAEFGHRRRVVC